MSDTPDLSVLPVRPPEVSKSSKRYAHLHPALPKVEHGEFGIMVSPVKTGKSTLISNLLLNPNFFKGCFDLVYIISNTIHNDKTSRFLREQYPNTCYAQYTDALMDQIVTYQESFPADERPAFALILDDFIGIKQRAKVFAFATRYRHYNCKLLLMSTQLFRALPPVARQNATFAVIGGPNPNGKEVCKLSEEFGDCYGGPDNLCRLYKYATREPYSFMYMPLQENPSVAYKGFTDKIYEGRNLVTVYPDVVADDAEGAGAAADPFAPA